MTAPGPSELGRSVVVHPGGDIPSAWAECDRMVVGPALFSNRAQLLATVNDLQRRYVRRVPTVIELGVDNTELSEPESTNSPPFELGGTFTFLRERLAKAVWHNSYDARTDQLIWWWAQKAEARLQVSVSGPADVLLPDGTPAWIDGGPRQEIDIDRKSTRLNSSH